MPAFIISPYWLLLLAGAAGSVWLIRRQGRRHATEVERLRGQQRTWFDGVPGGLYEAQPDGGFVRVNPALVRLLGGGQAEELLRLSAGEVEAMYLEAENRRRVFARADRTEDALEFESRVRRCDGAVIWVRETVRAVRDDRGRLVCLQGFVADITTGKQTERALSDSEDRWRLALQGSAAGMWENNQLTGETFYSDRCKEILGFAPHELSNNRMDWVGRIHPDDVKRGIQAMQDHLAGRRPYYEVEHRFRSKDGTYKWILSRGRALFDAQGRATRIVGTHIDIHERRQAEERLRTSEARYRMLFEHSPVAVVEFDFESGRRWLEARRAEGITDLRAYFSTHAGREAEILEPVKLTGVNSAAMQLMGAPSLADIVAALPRLMTGEALQTRVEFYLGLWEGRRLTEREVTVRALDGSLRRLLTRWWVPMVDGRPNYAQAQIAMLDLTQMKSAELALAQERERLRVTLEAMAEGVVTVDPDGRVRFVNHAACALMGCRDHEAAGREVAQLLPLVDGSTDKPFDWTGEILNRNRAVELPPRTRLHCGDGRRLTVDGRGAPMHDAHGRTVGAVLVLRDVSARVQLEEELQRAARLESVGLLAGGIAHDFNNILAVVMGNLTLSTMDETVQGSRAAIWLREAEQATLRARDLTQQLLTFAKGGDPVRATVQLTDLVQEAARFALHGASARCEFELANNLRPARVDPGQIGQVVQNLVLNAVQAMPGGGIIRIALSNVEVTASDPNLAAGHYLRLVISDRGQGIDPENLPRIFEPYFTTRPQGFGLGLATAYSIVKKHGGHIGVESEPGRGTRFDLWLPASDEPVAAPPPVPTAAVPAKLQGRVLFMDDDAPIRQMALLLLAKLGVEAVPAADGAEAVQLYEQAMTENRRFDAVIMDLTVPGGMGGREAMEHLRAIDPGVRAIVSSGYSSDPVMADHRAHGFQAMVAKPYRVADVAAALREVLAAARPD